MTTNGKTRVVAIKDIVYLDSPSDVIAPKGTSGTIRTIEEGYTAVVFDEDIGLYAVYSGEVE
jgi:hypothetical protein